jgi:hypothetical protein
MRKLRETGASLRAIAEGEQISMSACIHAAWRSLRTSNRYTSHQPDEPVPPGSFGFVARSSTRRSLSRFLLVVVTIAVFRSSLAAGCATLGAASPEWRGFTSTSGSGFLPWRRLPAHQARPLSFSAAAACSDSAR